MQRYQIMKQEIEIRQNLKHNHKVDKNVKCRLICLRFAKIVYVTFSIITGVHVDIDQALIARPVGNITVKVPVISAMLVILIMF